MTDVADQIRAALVPFLLAGGVLLAVLFVSLLARRAVETLVERHRQRLIVRYRPLVDALLSPAACGEAIDRLRQSPLRHRDVIAGLMLTPLAVASGAFVGRLRDATRALGLIDRWTRHLGSRHWWIRADGVRALGLVHEHAALDGLIAALHDPHDEVRAAAVEALGMLEGQPGIAALVATLGEPSRHQRARVVEALRRRGEAAASALVLFAREHLGTSTDAIDVLGQIGSPAAVGDLIVWSTDARPAVRASALQALGSIGLDDRSYYHALRALLDEHADVRAMAARALGRSRRAEAVPYLAAHLHDEWQVAAHAAAALRAIGPPGLQALQSRTTDSGHAGELSRQAAWEERWRVASLRSKSSSSCISSP
jgi:hypothetical protein